MKILALFAVGALLGTVSCIENYSECFQREFTACSQRQAKETDKSFCSGLKAQAKCTYNAAQECDMGFIQEAYKAQKVIDRACMEETDQYFLNARRCYGRAVGDGHCIKRIDNIMKDRKTPKEILEGHRESCMEVDWFKRCMVTNVEDTCGGINEEFFSYFLNPLVALHKRICREVVFSEFSVFSSDVFFGAYKVPSVFDIIIDIFTKV